MTLFRRYFRLVVVYEWQSVLLYESGKHSRTLGPGRYLLFTPLQTFTTVDLRSQILNVINQEIICVDSLAVRVSCSATFKIADPVIAMHSVTVFRDALHLEMQLAMRELVSPKKVEEVLAQRNEISDAFGKAVVATGPKFGLAIESAAIRDITFPADVKKVFAQVANAEKAAQAMLAKSRAETASLRALANASRMMEDHPALLSLRTLQSISELANSSGNTVIVGLPSGVIPLPQNGSKTKTPAADSE